MIKYMGDKDTGLLRGNLVSCKTLILVELLQAL